jgi:hypothetical protein
MQQASLPNGTGLPLGSTANLWQATPRPPFYPEIATLLFDHRRSDLKEFILAIQGTSAYVLQGTDIERQPKATNPMSPAKTLPDAILETIVTRLAALFLSGAAGDMAAARQAAAQMLTAYHPQTEDELRLAANIVGFSFHALEALGQAATPDMPLTKILRLRGSAVSLSRESHKAQRRLNQLQKARREGIPAQPAETRPEPAQPEPRIEKALDLIEDTRAITVAASAEGLTWTQAYQQRHRDTRIAASLKRAEARIAAQANIAALGAISAHRAMAQAV